jgi:hypothetical protein
MSFNDLHYLWSKSEERLNGLHSRGFHLSDNNKTLLLQIQNYLRISNWYSALFAIYDKEAFQEKALLNCRRAIFHCFKAEFFYYWDKLEIFHTDFIKTNIYNSSNFDIDKFSKNRKLANEIKIELNNDHADLFSEEKYLKSSKNLKTLSDYYDELLPFFEEGEAKKEINKQEKIEKKKIFNYKFGFSEIFSFLAFLIAIISVSLEVHRTFYIENQKQIPIENNSKTK